MYYLGIAVLINRIYKNRQMKDLFLPDHGQSIEKCAEISAYPLSADTTG